MRRTKTTARKSIGGKAPRLPSIGGYCFSHGSTSLICSYNWIIRNYTFCFDETSSFLSSPIFVVRSIPNTEWCLRLSQESNYMGVHLATNCMGETSFSKDDDAPSSNKDRSSSSSSSDSENSEDEMDMFNVKLVVIGARGVIGVEFHDDLRVNSEGGLSLQCGSYRFISKEKIENDTLHSDTITVCCNMYSCYNKRKYERIARIVEIRDNYVAKTSVLVDKLTWGYKFNSSQLIDTEQKIPVKDGSFGISGISFLKNENLKMRIHFVRPKVNKYHGFIIDCNITLLNGSCKICSERKRGRFDSSKPFWEFILNAFSLPLRNLLTSGKEKEFTLLCEFAFSDGKKLHTLDIQEEDLRNIFSNRNNCGVSFETGEVLEANRTVLDTQSPSIFDQNGPEDQSVRIAEDFSGEISTVNLFSDCLNTDRIAKMDYERAKLVILNAEKYSKHLSYLKEKSLALLKSAISEKNACEILSLAGVSHCNELKDLVVDFLVANSDKFLSKPQWLEWIKDNMQLASVVLSKISTRLSTSQTTECASTSNSEHQQKKRRVD
ncbi:uncharacterized protein [Parasteatoda tepidariorum]|uniref:uncharacterized protein isoform X1 n=1 Tax=Parasteatoda tepidariorum TaxID=114398 RepID=UPI001C718A8A|nr:uncharacterized protein LOC107438111 [Parasteatoda tepidariorum]